MVFVDASGMMLAPHALERDRRDCHPALGVVSASQEFGVSSLRLHRLRIGIESADQHVLVLLGACGQVGNKGLDQISIRFFQGWRTAEIGSVSLNESGVEIVLADQ